MNLKAQNNYELIADTIEKKEPEFSEAYKEWKNQSVYGDIVEKLQADGLLVKDPEVVRMTKRGLFLGDSVAEQFILED